MGAIKKAFNKAAETKKSALSLISSVLGVFYFIVLAIVEIISLLQGNPPALLNFTNGYGVLPVVFGALLLGGDNFIAMLAEMGVDIARAKWGKHE